MDNRFEPMVTSCLCKAQTRSFRIYCFFRPVDCLLDQIAIVAAIVDRGLVTVIMTVDRGNGRDRNRNRECL